MRWGPVKKRVIVYGSLLGALLLAAVLGWAYMFTCACPRAKEPRERTADLAPLEAALRRHVETLAGTIGERNADCPDAYARAADYVKAQFAAAGYDVGETSYEVDGVRCRILEASIPGASRPREIVVVGAHYDSVQGTVGADDNASGVAALLEIARALRGETPARTVRFVAFPNEEPPHFGTDAWGARVHARAARKRRDDVVAMLSLETIGYYKDAPGSQQYPPIVRSLYPDRGNFVGVVGNLGSRGLVHRVVRAMREATAFPVECAATFESIEGVDWSDHAAFWDAGYDAVMITDTAIFRNPHYHTPGDAPETLDYAALARVTFGLTHAVRRLASPQ